MHDSTHVKHLFEQANPTYAIKWPNVAKWQEEVKLPYPSLTALHRRITASTHEDGDVSDLCDLFRKHYAGPRDTIEIWDVDAGFRGEGLEVEIHWTRFSDRDPQKTTIWVMQE